MDELERLQYELERYLDADPPDHRAVAEIMEKMLAHPDANDLLDIPATLEDLATAYAELGRLDDAIRTAKRAVAAGENAAPISARLLLADLYLRAGRFPDAHAAYDTVKAAEPGAAWIYHVAASDYLSAGDRVRALQWVDEGIAVAKRAGDPDGILKRLLARREQIAPAGAVKPKQGTLAMGYFPEAQYALAAQRWPQFAQDVAATYDAYRRQVQASLVQLKAQGETVWLVPTAVAALERWCGARGLDPATARGRSEYAAHQLSQGVGRPWPPERNDDCWCGSGRKYKKCCGA